MSTIEIEIAALEDRLRVGELGPDADVFAELLADQAVLIGEDGEPFLAKAKVVEAHHPGKGPKFTRVEIADLKIVPHDNAAVVTCKGTYYTGETSMTLKFMRVWLKTDNRWQMIAGSVLR